MSEMRWTAEQLAAIRSGPALLSASAGTGKTTTVVGKILWRLGLPIGVDQNGDPVPLCREDYRLTLSQVAAITFTEKAAYDLKRKLRDELQEKAPALVWEIDQATIGTIHGFCGQLLREQALRFGIDPGFSVLDEHEARLHQDEIVRDVILQALREDDEGAVTLVERYTLEGYSRAQGVVDYVRRVMRDLRWHAERYQDWTDDTGGLDLARLRELAQQWSEKDDPSHAYCQSLILLARRAVADWERFQQEENVRDFDSLILDLRRLLQGGKGTAALTTIWQRYDLLIIDEFQDTDGAQRDIAFAIAPPPRPDVDDAARPPGPQPPELFLVGDPKQSIFRFRHADITVWNEVREYMYGKGGRGKPLELTRNFRSGLAVVEFVNQVCEAAMTKSGAALEAERPESRVEYVKLEPARGESECVQVEWLEADVEGADTKREYEGGLVAARIAELVGSGAPIIDPAGDGARTRPCSYRDMAILFRARAGRTEFYEKGLRKLGIPYYLAGDRGTTGRLEILDLLNVLRLIENPGDDLRAFAYLRSPFVGLRDEVIARMRWQGNGKTLLLQAQDFLEGGDWCPAPEHPRIEEIEKDVLRDGLAVIDEMSTLHSRLPIDHLLEEVIDRTGYREHLFFLDQPEHRLANIRQFLQLLRGYRNHNVSTFIQIWERWEDMNRGIPQAPLHSKDDDVVTLSTIHSAKGLEWPIVFLVDNDVGFADKLSNEFWSDRELGPVFCPTKDDRGERTRIVHAREKAEAKAEEARLLYVATTRARDRLIIAGSTAKPEGAGEWLNVGLDLVSRKTSTPAKVTQPALAPEPSLAWLDDIEPADTRDPLVAPLPPGRRRRFRSATELMAHERSRWEWQLKYWHGVTPPWYFAPESRSGHEVPGWVRGVVIHGVLEKLQDEAEISGLLDETIGALDAPELEERMAAATEYRRALEQEIARVAAGDEWKSYTEGAHYRELSFVQLVSPGKWRVGAYDLYRPSDGESWIIDFKTHEIEPRDVEATASDYRLQGLLYRNSARALAGETRVTLHFTVPNKAVEILRD